MEQFLVLYEEVYRDLYRIAYYYMGNVQEAEDAVGDATLKAYENYHHLRQEEAFRSWIIKILINCCKSRMRKWFQKQETLDDTELYHEPDYLTIPIVETAMDVLEEEERLIVALYIYGGYKGEEISRMIHKKHSTVRSKYHRALYKMKKYLES